MRRAEQAAEESIRCSISARLLLRLLREGVLRAEQLQCLDRGSQQALRRIIARSCESQPPL